MCGCPTPRAGSNSRHFPYGLASVETHTDEVKTLMRPWSLFEGVDVIRALGEEYIYLWINKLVRLLNPARLMP